MGNIKPPLTRKFLLCSEEKHLQKCALLYIFILLHTIFAHSAMMATMTYRKKSRSQRSIIVDQQKKWAEIQSEEQNIRNKEKVEKKG